MQIWISCVVIVCTSLPKKTCCCEFYFESIALSSGSYTHNMSICPLAVHMKIFESVKSADPLMLKLQTNSRQLGKRNQSLSSLCSHSKQAFLSTCSKHLNLSIFGQLSETKLQSHKLVWSIIFVWNKTIKKSVDIS